MTLPPYRRHPLPPKSNPQVDFLTWQGNALALGKPLQVAVLGSASQTMTTYMSGQVRGVVGGGRRSGGR